LSEAIAHLRFETRDVATTSSSSVLDNGDIERISTDDLTDKTVVIGG